MHTFENEYPIPICMKDGTKLILGIATGIFLMLISVVLLIWLDISLWVFLAMNAAGTALIFLPIASIDGDWVSLEEDGIRIDAPFVDLRIPFGSIIGADMVTGFKPGLRLYGLDLLKRGSGDFTNSTLGSYIFAGTVAVDRMIIVRFADKKTKTVAFNLPTVEATEDMFSRIVDATGSRPLDIPSSESEAGRRSHRSWKRKVAALVAVSIIVVVGLIAVTMTVGHAGAYLRDDALVIDATGMKKTVGFDEIVGVELRYDMGYGSRIGGTANSKILTGTFRNDEFGTYHLAVNRSVDACIVVFTEGKTKVFNLESDTETEEFFHELESRLPPRTAGFIASPYQCTARCRRRRMPAPRRSGSVRGSWGSAPWMDGTSIRSNLPNTVRRASSPGRGAWSSWGYRCTFR